MIPLTAIFILLAACPLVVGWVCRGRPWRGRMLAVGAASFLLAAHLSVQFLTVTRGIVTSMYASAHVDRDSREITGGRVVRTEHGLAVDVVIRDTERGDEWPTRLALAFAPPPIYPGYVFLFVFGLSLIASFGMSSIPVRTASSDTIPLP